jgi:hypothetical protein
MSSWNQLITIRRLIRAHLKDRLCPFGRDSYIFIGSANFTLTEDYPDSTTIVVYKNGTALSSGWSYNSSTNILTITSLLATNDIILITYSFYDKYSENELTDYIESSLCYFSQFGYKKTFKLNDARTEVLAIDGENPTVKEGYEIAIITAINIDPENISIRTKDFSLTAANEKYSKTELISNALQQFSTWYGDFSFDEDYRTDVS